jgi:hypothetical protein
MKIAIYSSTSANTHTHLVSRLFLSNGILISFLLHATMAAATKAVQTTESSLVKLPSGMKRKIKRGRGDERKISSAKILNRIWICSYFQTAPGENK